MLDLQLVFTMLLQPTWPTACVSPSGSLGVQELNLDENILDADELVPTCPGNLVYRRNPLAENCNDAIGFPVREPIRRFRCLPSMIPGYVRLINASSKTYRARFRMPGQPAFDSCQLLDHLRPKFAASGERHRQQLAVHLYVAPPSTFVASDVRKTAARASISLG